MRARRKRNPGGTDRTGEPAPPPVHVDIEELPIPDWGLECPHCRYPLRGLPSHRCPECGTELRMAELVHTWLRVRPPRLTGAERPLPDFGLRCAACEAALAGALADACPRCGHPFDLSALAPPKPWFELDEARCRPLAVPVVESRLAAEFIPHGRPTGQTAEELYTGAGRVPRPLLVSSEFFFEVLWLIQQIRREFEDARAMGAAWRCPACRKRNPWNFEVCWNCNRPQHGTDMTQP